MSTSQHDPQANLSPEQRAVLHRELLDALDRARSDLSAARHDFQTIVEASAQSNADDEHDPEGSTIAFERAQVSSRIERAVAADSAAAQALTRWDAGIYGVCEICGTSIGYERLLARPATTRCVDHAGR